MNEQFSRTIALFGEDSINKLQNTHVAIFGIGGVGGYVCEALARSGVGKFDLFDNDVISVSNINRQIIATYDTIGKSKVEVMKDRILSINPSAVVNIHQTFYSLDNADLYGLSIYNYIVDCIDTITSKIELIKRSKEANVPIISAMGTGNKVDPTKFEVVDISKTTNCPLARVVRKKLKELKISRLKVVYSKELPYNINLQENENIRKSIPASSSFVPPVCGMIMAGEVIKDIINA